MSSALQGAQDLNHVPNVGSGISFFIYFPPFILIEFIGVTLVKICPVSGAHAHAFLLDFPQVSGEAQEAYSVDLACLRITASVSNFGSNDSSTSLLLE